MKGHTFYIIASSVFFFFGLIVFKLQRFGLSSIKVLWYNSINTLNVRDLSNLMDSSF